MHGGTPAEEWSSLPVDWFQPGILPEDQRQALLQQLPRNWIEPGVLPEEHRLAFLKDFLAEQARKAEEFFRIDPHEWRERPREERERLILEGFTNLQKTIGLLGRRKRDYWDKYLYLEPLVEAEIKAGALEVSEATYRASTTHVLPVTGASSGDLDRHDFEWQDMFVGSKGLLEEKAKQLSPHDRLYRVFIIGDRIKNFCLTYLADRGVDDQFIPAVNSFLIELIAKAVTSPPDRPLPE